MVIRQDFFKVCMTIVPEEYLIFDNYDCDDDDGGNKTKNSKYSEEGIFSR